MGLKGTDLLAVYRTTDATNRKLSIEELGKHFGSNPPDTNEPISPNNGDMWVDTSECPPVLKIWSDCTGTGEWLEVQGGSNFNPIDPNAGDISSIPPLSGSGTQSDPFVPINASTRYGANAVTVETITISNQKEGDIVAFVDINGQANNNRFSQPPALIDASGVWSHHLRFSDVPATTTETDYTALLKIGEIYFEWTVSVEAPLTVINFAPTITGTNVVGDSLTADAGLIIGGTAPEVKVYQWKSDGVAVGTDSNTYVLVNSDVGNLITCEVTCAEPDDSNAVTKAATYSQTPAADTSSASLWEEDGNAVTPIATGADLAIEGTGTFAGKITADSFDLEALPALP